MEERLADASVASKRVRDQFDQTLLVAEQLNAELTVLFARSELATLHRSPQRICDHYGSKVFAQDRAG